MDDYERVRERWGLDLSEDYRRFWESGLLGRAGVGGLQLSRFWWLTPQGIADCEWPDYKIDQLVPFALTPGRDHFAWFVEKSGNPWTAKCPRDSDFAVGSAPSFTAFVYRALIEEMADTWLVDVLSKPPEEVQAMLGNYVLSAAPFLPASWVETLRRCAGRPIKPTKWQMFQTITSEEAGVIIRRDLAFPMLNCEFRQHQD